MKKILALLFVALATPAFADFTVNLDAGRLRLNLGTAMPAGSVLVLVAANGDGFSNTLSAGQYVSGNDILLSILTVPGSSGAFNISGGTDETLNTLTISATSFPGLAVGDLLALRWFPQITKTQFLAGTTQPLEIISALTTRFFGGMDRISQMAATRGLCPALVERSALTFFHDRFGLWWNPSSG